MENIFSCHSERSEESQNGLSDFAQDDKNSLTKTSYSPNTLFPYYLKKKCGFTKPSRTTSDSESQVCVNVDVESSLQTRAVVFNARRSFKKIAFTLAEVLITLGVIAVVAAITLPSLIENHQKRVVATSLKKAYAELNLALEMAKAEHGPDMSVWDYQKPEEIEFWAEKYMAPYVKVVEKESCRESFSFRCAGVTKPAHLGATTSFTHYNRAPYTIKKAGGAGKAWAFYKYGAYPEIRVHVYIKTYKNRLPMKGRDVFTFVLYPKDATFKPFGMPGTVPFTAQGHPTRDELLHGPIRTGGCFKESGGPDYYGPGDGCAAVIMMDGWEIKDDYPWKYTK